jgi:hypothetical protein
MVTAPSEDVGADDFCRQHHAAAATAKETTPTTVETVVEDDWACEPAAGLRLRLMRTDRQNPGAPTASSPKVVQVVMSAYIHFFDDGPSMVHAALAT